jgi:hypothetical protein
MIEEALKNWISDNECIRIYTEEIIPMKKGDGNYPGSIRKYARSLKSSYHIDLGIGCEIIERHILYRLADLYVSMLPETDKPFIPGDIIEYSGELFEVLENHGNSGRVREYPNGDVIQPFWWVFEGERCVLANHKK